MDALQITLIAMSYVTAIFSLPGNIFIIVVNIVDFCRNKEKTLGDRLIFYFSIFTFLHGLLEVCVLCIAILLFKDYDAIGFTVFFIMSTLWFSALLSIHYCLKIVTIHHWFYIRLQRGFPKSFPWIHLAFFLEFAFISFSSNLDKKQECLLNTTDPHAGSVQISPRCAWQELIFLIICALCTFLSSVSASTILISLCKHMKRIQGNSEGSGSPNIAAHIRAVRTVSTLLVTNILIFISMAIQLFKQESWIYLFDSLIFISYTFSSYFFIKGTKKLDKMLAEILNQCACLSGE
ncbi:taste receptor type 2 member 9-like [Dendropsophus ebraccatus]|uniref:taste receptor type 2 member 9-like n=1 Tax=Dendropsophus ebraccatus TaxID=150705 RepID=UPI00383160CB